MLKPYFKKGAVEAGCDEAGTGCLAGPVFAAAVILPPDVSIQDLDDSKKLTETRRNTLREQIEDQALAWAVASVDPEEIDEVNILNASFLAMHRALDQLAAQPDHLLIDGNRFRPYQNIPYQCIIGGDGKFLSIAAASVLAKTYRDDHMKQLHELFPQYQWASNKGYPTPDHRKAIMEHGVVTVHRKSFRLTNDQLVINFSEEK
jgi:ribonuclease HII